MRFRSPENIVEEIAYQKERFGIRDFGVLDDCFNANIKRAKRICTLILERDLDITLGFSAGIRADHFDEELAHLLKKAGSKFLAFGVETMDEYVSDKIHKKLELDKVKQAVKICRKNGIISYLFFIIGHYWDTKDSVEKTIQGSLELDADFNQYANLMPIPGSEVYSLLAEEGRLTFRDYHEFSPFFNIGSGKLLFSHPNLSDQDVVNYTRQARNKSLFRIRTVLVLLKHPKVIVNTLRIKMQAWFKKCLF